MTHSSSKDWRTQPALVRAAPFVVFVLLTACQGKFGEASRYWVYFAKTLVGAAMVWSLSPWIKELRWQWSWEAVVVGIGVFAFWVGLDGYYPSIDSLGRTLLCPILKPLGFEKWCVTPVETPAPWNPHQQFGPALAWGFAIARLLGSTLVVPPLEEVFYRSFLYRYIARQDFLAMALRHFAWMPFLVTSTIFGLAHYEWLPGILCGMVYQGLVIRKDRLGDAMTAHAITNFLLGCWVISRGAWHFW